MAEEKKKYAVVMWRDLNEVEHPEEGGYVVRTAYLQADGTYWIPKPYGKAKPVRLYANEKAAEKFADNLNEKRKHSGSFNEESRLSILPPW